MIKICPACKNRFKTSDKNKVYCTQKCANSMDYKKSKLKPVPRPAKETETTDTATESKTKSKKSSKK